MSWRLLVRVLVVSLAVVGCVEDMGDGEVAEADLSLRPDGAGNGCHQAGACVAVGARCEGDVAVTCKRLGNGCLHESRVNCEAQGGVCELSNAVAMCELAEDVEPPPTCVSGVPDPACPELCDNGLDDDADGLVDCDDAACGDQAACQLEVCYDLLDNDGDGQVDCADDDCTGTVLCPAATCPNATLGSGVGLDLATQVITGRLDDHDGYCAVGGGQDLSFEWIAPSTGCFEFSVTSAEFSPVLQLQGSCDGPDWVCVGAGGGPVAHLQWQLTAGQATTVIVDSVDASARGAFTLGIMPCR